MVIAEVFWEGTKEDFLRTSSLLFRVQVEALALVVVAMAVVGPGHPPTSLRDIQWYVFTAPGLPLDHSRYK
ncbi:hypothetical protein CDL15_Pgr022995 [Punica granatum]|nr:hypothetical protein CDL15_Pgr022995 [Punica granatum]